MPPFPFTEADVQARTTPKVFERGVKYAQQRAVGRLTLRGDVLHAAVAGSEVRPYLVRIRFAAGSIGEARCSCPYEWEGWCKHVAAVLLTVLRAPERVAERPALEEALGGLDEEQLRALALHLADRHPRLIPKIEAWISEQRRP